MHRSRHTVSPYADCFTDHSGALHNGAKSQFAKYTRRNNRVTVYPLNKIYTVDPGHRDLSASLYEVQLPKYFSSQIYMMNALHFRGDTRERGTSLEWVIPGKMKNIFRKWINPQLSELLHQPHFHIDDPNFFISHKIAEQRRRDSAKYKNIQDDVHNEA